MPVPRSVFPLAFASLMVLTGCADGLLEPSSRSGGTEEGQGQLPIATSSQPSGNLVGTLTLHDAAGKKGRSFAVTRGDQQSSPAIAGIAELQESLRSLAPANSREARMAHALLNGTAAERAAASAPYLRGIALNSEISNSAVNSAAGSLRRGDREWISWSVGQRGAAEPLSERYDAPSSGAQRQGRGSTLERAQTTAASRCIDCILPEDEEDYDPNFDPHPPVWEMAGVFAFALELEAMTYAAPLPQECIGYQAAFASALATTLSMATVTTVSAFARMPATTAKYGRLSVQGVFATYVAWEFLEACKRQYRR